MFGLWQLSVYTTSEEFVYKNARRTVACWKQETEPDHMTSADPTRHRVGSSLLQVKGQEHWGLGSGGPVSTWETSTRQTAGFSTPQIKEYFK